MSSPRSSSTRSVAVIIAALLGIAMFGAVAAAETFLPPANAVKLLADGRPWSAVTADNRQARMTLRPDGTGSFEGPFTLPVAWSIKGQDVCFALGIVGTKCLRFRRIDGGLEGWQGAVADLKLTR